MFDKFLDKNKKLIILCLVVLGINVLSLFLIRKTELFCGQSSYNSFDVFSCGREIRDGFAFPITTLTPYLLFSLLVLFFVSDRLKRNAVIAVAIISVPILLLVFLSPVSCGSLICSREDLSMITRNFYPIVTILTLATSGVYFYLRDKTSLKRSSVIILSILSAFILILPLVILFLIES